MRRVRPNRLGLERPVLVCHPMRILLVEDEDSIRGALLRAFERDGHEVRAAATVAEGRTMSEDWNPELMVSDLKLPDGDGLSLAAILAIPFVMLSGYATYDDAVRALRLGAVDFFTKPVAIKDVRAAIARVQPRGAGLPVLSWTDPAAARAAVTDLLPVLPGHRARLALAELAQSAESGRIEVVVDHTGVRLWLDAQVSWPPSDDRCRWLRAHDISLVIGEYGAVARVATEPATTYDESTELFWPQEFMSGRAIQCGHWTMVGSWFLAAVRAGIGPFAGLSQGLIAACGASGLTIQPAPAGLGKPGIGGSERSELLADDDLGPLLA